MEEQRPNTERKRDGFRGERMIVLPTEAFSDYVRHPLVRRLYLTDVGFFPSAAHHYRERREGIEEYIFLYCMDGSGQITVEDDGQPELEPGAEDITLDMLADHEERLCMLELTTTTV